MADDEGIISLGERRARRLIEEGLGRFQTGDVEGAAEKFLASIEAHPTAEGHTFYGWMLSYKGNFKQAIAECRKAIAVDPDFGNPYNDIGSYLMHLGRLDDAIPWLEKATTAARYEPRHYPHMNLGRIYAAKGQLLGAVAEFRKALEHDPDNPQLLRMLEELRGRLN